MSSARRFAPKHNICIVVECSSAYNRSYRTITAIHLVDGCCASAIVLLGNCSQQQHVPFRWWCISLMSQLFDRAFAPTGMNWVWTNVEWIFFCRSLRRWTIAVHPPHLHHRPHHRNMLLILQWPFGRSDRSKSNHSSDLGMRSKGLIRRPRTKVLPVEHLVWVQLYFHWPMERTQNVIQFKMLMEWPRYIHHRCDPRKGIFYCIGNWLFKGIIQCVCVLWQLWALVLWHSSVWVDAIDDVPDDANSLQHNSHCEMRGAADQFDIELYLQFELFVISFPEID